MKKFVSLLMTVLMFATMLTVFAVPASAQTELRGEISGTHTYDDNVFIDSDVTIASGASVTFNNLIVITNESTFTIEPDATVTINNNLFIDATCTFDLYGKLAHSRELCLDSGLNVRNNGEIIVCDHVSGGTGSTPAVGSALSEENMIIICTIAAAVVFGLGGFILGTKKKKKTAVAGGENTDEE